MIALSGVPASSRLPPVNANIHTQESMKLGRSFEITFAHAESLILAAAHATATGHCLNRFITITFKHPDERIRTQEALQKFIKLASDWLRYNDAPVAYIWVVENPVGVDEHVHILIHVPHNMAARFSRLTRKWIRRTGAEVYKGVARSEPIVSFDGLMGLLRYLLKGCSPEAAAMFRIRLEPQGWVTGKRCGMSQSLGATARARDNGVVAPHERPCSTKSSDGSEWNT